MSRFSTCPKSPLFRDCVSVRVSDCVSDLVSFCIYISSMSTIASVTVSASILLFLVLTVCLGCLFSSLSFVLLPYTQDIQEQNSSFMIPLFLLTAAPSTATINATLVNTSSSSCTVRWAITPEEYQHGHFDGYKVYYNSTEPFQATLYVVYKCCNVATTTVVNLTAYVNYTLYVRGYDSKGDSVTSDQLFCRTAEDGMIF